jgi:membrane protein
VSLPSYNPAIPSYSPEMRETYEQRVWRIVAHSPLDSLWGRHGNSLAEIARRTGKSVIDDRVFGRAAELAFYFLFSIFPALFGATAILGLAARQAHQIYTRLLAYLALVVPPSALGIVMHIFSQTTTASNSGKITFSLLGAIWSASVGVSAIQGTLNDVYRIENTRSLIGARVKAIGLTLLVTGIGTLVLASMFLGDFEAGLAAGHIENATLSIVVASSIRIVAWGVATALLVLIFAVIYYWAPDWRRRRWRWFTPGAAVGILGWLVASLGLRVYLQFFNNYAVTYGSLGAVIILLTWFYISGLMLLVGGELNSVIEAAAVEKRLAEHRIQKPQPRAA